MFTFLKEKLTKVYSQFTSKVHALFSSAKLEQKSLDELYKLLIQADVGVITSKAILDNLQQQFKDGTLRSGDDIKQHLQMYLTNILDKHVYKPGAPESPCVIMLVGINGSGKTTAAGKLAFSYSKQNAKVLLVGADTFRAAAVQQLHTWSERSNVAFSCGKEGQDPSSVVYEACQKFKQENFSTLIIDTAGRLQTKEPLMRELQKIKRTLERQLPDVAVKTLLTIDAMLGQNSFAQAEIFNQATALEGIVLTKMDGTAKGGIVFAIQQNLSIPIAYIAAGEAIEDIKLFNVQDYIQAFISA